MINRGMSAMAKCAPGATAAPRVTMATPDTTLRYGIIYYTVCIRDVNIP